MATSGGAIGLCSSNSRTCPYSFSHQPLASMRAIIAFSLLLASAISLFAGKSWSDVQGCEERATLGEMARRQNPTRLRHTRNAGGFEPYDTTPLGFNYNDTSGKFLHSQLGLGSKVLTHCWETIHLIHITNYSAVVFTLVASCYPIHLCRSPKQHHLLSQAKSCAEVFALPLSD